MQSIRDISIKNKLILMQVFTSVLVLALCFAAFVITDIRGYKERKVNSTNSIAQVIGSNCLSALQFLDNEAASKILSELQRIEPDVVNASIIDSKGNEFASYTKPGNIKQAIWHPFKDNSTLDDKHLYVYRYISTGTDTVGTVCLKVALTQLQEIKIQKYKITAVLVIVGVALAFLIALINQRYISKPLLYLVNVMKQIRESNDYSKPVNLEGKDEISSLSREFNDLMKEVAKSNRKKDEFIGIASHELKTPLTSVKLYLQTLARMKHDPVANTFLLKASDGVDKLQKLIIDLLDVSKIEAGQLQLKKEQVDIDELIEDCIQSSQLSTNVHTVKRMGASLSSTISADRDRLEQVLINFISNAIKYSPGNTEILVGAENVPGGVMISVTDFGLGIPISEQSKVFDRFYRSNENHAVVSGFGLGLYICTQIIKRHQGTIGLNSEEGKGSTFYFCVPASSSEAINSISKRL